MTLRRSLAALAVPAALLAAATPAAAETPAAATCWGNQSIIPTGTTITCSAATVCGGTADYLQVSVFIRHRDRLGVVSTCGLWSTASANWTNLVGAQATSCLSSGTGDLYWIYSEHYAEIDGQVFDFTAGGWDTPT